jgi:hypothetical protein
MWTINRWTQLCERACNECDLEKLMKLVREINRLPDVRLAYLLGDERRVLRAELRQ